MQRDSNARCVRVCVVAIRVLRTPLASRSFSLSYVDERKARRVLKNCLRAKICMAKARVARARSIIWARRSSRTKMAVGASALPIRI